MRNVLAFMFGVIVAVAVLGVRERKPPSETLPPDMQVWLNDQQPPVIPYPNSPAFTVALPMASNGWLCTTRVKRIKYRDGLDVLCIAH